GDWGTMMRIGRVGYAGSAARALPVTSAAPQHMLSIRVFMSLPRIFLYRALVISARFRRRAFHRVIASPRHCITTLLSCYLMASGLTGEPTAPVIGSAGATNRNS